MVGGVTNSDDPQSVALLPVRHDWVRPLPTADSFIVRRPGSRSATWLNHTAVIVLELSNGSSSPAAIAQFLADAYQLAATPTASVERCLEELLAAGLIDYSPAPPTAEHHVLVCVSTPHGTVDATAHQAVAELPNLSPGHGFRSTLHLATDEVIRRGWNDTASSVASSATFTHVLFLDSATSATIEQLQRALHSGHDVVSLAPPRPPLRWERAAELSSALTEISANELAGATQTYAVTFDRSASGHQLVDGFMEAASVAVNGLLVSRNALLKLAGSELVTRYSRQWSAHGCIDRPGWGFFDPVITPDGDATDEEASFSTRWRSIGGKIWVDLSGGLGHAISAQRRATTGHS
jgi:hypothetical protein